MQAKQAAQAVACFAALAQATRLAIFRALVQAGPDGLAAGAIAQILGLAPSTLSFHLAHLAKAGVVIAAPQGRQIIYTAGFAQLDWLSHYLLENCCSGRYCPPAGATKKPC